jgi:hypothetical protein
MSSQRRAALALLTALSALTACSSGGTSANASCAAPQTTVTSAKVRPGDVLQVQALHMWTDCADTGEGDRGEARQDQAVVWIQSGQDTVLTHLDADPETGTGTATVQIPAQATAGRAQIRIGEAESALVTVRAPETEGTS